MQRNPDFAISADLAESFVWQKALRFDALAASRLPCVLLFLLRSLSLHAVALVMGRCPCCRYPCMTLLFPRAVTLAASRCFCHGPLTLQALLLCGPFLVYAFAIGARPNRAISNKAPVLSQRGTRAKGLMLHPARSTRCLLCCH